MPNSSGAPEPDSKVLFRVASNDPNSDEAEVETLWALNLGNDRYKLDNLPYFAYSVSCDDIVYAPFDEDEGFPTFREVVEKSGNRTVRLIFELPFAKGNKTNSVLSALVELGCEYEGANKRYFCVNIPPACNLDTVIECLIENDVEFELC